MSSFTKSLQSSKSIEGNDSNSNSASAPLLKLSCWLLLTLAVANATNISSNANNKSNVKLNSKSPDVIVCADLSNSLVVLIKRLALIATDYIIQYEYYESSNLQDATKLSQAGGAIHNDNMYNANTDSAIDLITIAMLLISSHKSITSSEHVNNGKLSSNLCNILGTTYSVAIQSEILYRVQMEVFPSLDKDRIISSLMQRKLMKQYEYLFAPYHMLSMPSMYYDLNSEHDLAIPVHATALSSKSKTGAEDLGSKVTMNRVISSDQMTDNSSETVNSLPSCTNSPRTEDRKKSWYEGLLANKKDILNKGLGNINRKVDIKVDTDVFMAANSISAPVSVKGKAVYVPSWAGNTERVVEESDSTYNPTLSQPVSAVLSETFHVIPKADSFVESSSENRAQSCFASPTGNSNDGFDRNKLRSLKSGAGRRVPRSAGPLSSHFNNTLLLTTSSEYDNNEDDVDDVEENVMATKVNSNESSNSNALTPIKVSKSLSVESDDSLSFSKPVRRIRSNIENSSNIQQEQQLLTSKTGRVQNSPPNSRREENVDHLYRPPHNRAPADSKPHDINYVHSKRNVVRGNNLANEGIVSSSYDEDWEITSPKVNISTKQIPATDTKVSFSNRSEIRMDDKPIKKINFDDEPLPALRNKKGNTDDVDNRYRSSSEHINNFEISPDNLNSVKSSDNLRLTHLHTSAKPKVNRTPPKERPMDINISDTDMSSSMPRVPRTPPGHYDKDDSVRNGLKPTRRVRLNSDSDNCISNENELESESYVATPVKKSVQHSPRADVSKRKSNNNSNAHGDHSHSDVNKQESLAIKTEVEYKSREEILPCGNVRDQQREYNKVLAQIETADWPEIFHIITTVRSLSIHHHEFLINNAANLRQLIKGLLKQVGNLRSQVAKNAIITVGDLFTDLGRHLDTDILLIATGLIKRLCDSSAFVSDSCEDALTSMIDNGTVNKTLVALLSNHESRSAAIRGRVAGLLLRLVESKIEELKSVYFKDTSNRDFDILFNRLPKLVGDHTPEGRAAGRGIIRLLLQYNVLTMREMEMFVPADVLDKVMKENLSATSNINAPIISRNAPSLKSPVNIKPPSALYTSSNNISDDFEEDTIDAKLLSKPNSKAIVAAKNRNVEPEKGNSSPSAKQTKPKLTAKKMLDNNPELLVMNELIYDISSKKPWMEKCEAMTKLTELVVKYTSVIHDLNKLDMVMDSYYTSLLDGSIKVGVAKPSLINIIGSYIIDCNACFDMFAADI